MVWNVDRRLAFMVVAGVISVRPVLLVASPPREPGTDSSEPQTRTAEAIFREQYSTALRGIESSFADVDVSGTLSDSWIRPGKPSSPQTSKIRLQCTRGSSKYEKTIEALSKDGATATSSEVCCRNAGKYVFQLRRASADSRFAVLSLEPKDSPPSDSMERYAYRYLNASYSVGGVPLSEILSDPGFSVRSVDYVHSDSELLVHVSYALAPTSLQILLRGGELWLSPDLGWALRRFRSDLDPLGRSDLRPELLGTVEYQGLRQGIAIPKRVLFTQKIGKSVRNEVFVVERFDFRETPPEQFTLTHYNVAETVPADYVLTTNVPSHWLQLLTLNGILVVMFVLVWIWRRWIRAKRMSS